MSSLPVVVHTGFVQSPEGGGVVVGFAVAVGVAVVAVGVGVGVGVGLVVVAGAVVVAAGAGAVVVVAVGVVGVVVTPLATVKFAKRLEVVPSDHVSTTLMPCDPSASFFVSYGTAVPSAAVPAKSKGGSVSVRTGNFLRHRPSR